MFHRCLEASLYQAPGPTNCVSEVASRPWRGRTLAINPQRLSARWPAPPPLLPHTRDQARQRPAEGHVPSRQTSNPTQVPRRTQGPPGTLTVWTIISSSSWRGGASWHTSTLRITFRLTPGQLANDPQRASGCGKNARACATQAFCCRRHKAFDHWSVTSNSASGYTWSREGERR